MIEKIGQQPANSKNRRDSESPVGPVLIEKTAEKTRFAEIVGDTIEVTTITTCPVTIHGHFEEDES